MWISLKQYEVPKSTLKESQIPKSSPKQCHVPKNSLRYWKVPQSGQISFTLGTSDHRRQIRKQGIIFFLAKCYLKAELFILILMLLAKSPPPATIYPLLNRNGHLISQTCSDVSYSKNPKNRGWKREKAPKKVTLFICSLPGRFGAQ